MTIRGQGLKGLDLTRRALIKYGLILPSTAQLPLYVSSALIAAPNYPGAKVWPTYWIRRERDELFLRLTAVGYLEHGHEGNRYLRPASSKGKLYLIFELAPQHFAETALAVDEIPVTFDENKLGEIQLLPSAPSRLVFFVRHRKPLKLALSEVLAWHNFDLVLPDLANVGQEYDLDVPDGDVDPSTRVEIPWGVKLSPVTQAGQKFDFTFTDASSARTSDNWTELWTTALKDKHSTGVPNPIAIEVLGVTGFDKVAETGSVDADNLTITYKDRSGQKFPNEPTPLSNYDRIDIATSLSRRFRYTGEVNPLKDSAIIEYQDGSTPPKCVSACFAQVARSQRIFFF